MAVNVQNVVEIHLYLNNNGHSKLLFDIKGNFIMWKPNESCLSHSLVVLLLFLSLVKSRSR